MRITVMICDRCKKEFEKWDHKKPALYGVAEFVHDSGDRYLDSPKDLCGSCYNDFINWWDFVAQEESEDKK